ncbi:MAG: HypC/HybG/HupF family hydrogenase formation chaperone [Oscillospiraceae bacterium]|nr:HypC/HybG/HupF family hydrogenase formation chaperone [Oscillospiraceae bacterium]
MCLAVPLKITEINGKEAVAESMGMRRRIRVDFIENPKIGEYVIVHAGFAIERLPDKQAREDLEAWEELEEAITAGYGIQRAEKR